MKRAIAGVVISALLLGSCSNSNFFGRYFPYPPGVKALGPGEYGPGLELVALVVERRSRGILPWSAERRWIEVAIRRSDGTLVETLEVSVGGDGWLEVEGEWVSSEEFRVSLSPKAGDAGSAFDVTVRLGG